MPHQVIGLPENSSNFSINNPLGLVEQIVFSQDSLKIISKSQANTMSGYDFNDPKFLFLDILSLVERLHRRLLDVLKNHMEHIGCNDLNPVQALLLHNIGENEMTAGELKTRGYYQGSNVSYNLKKLVEMGYLRHERSDYDRRAVRISLTDKGYEIRNLIDDLYKQHLDELLQDDLINHDELKNLRKNLRNLERYWSDKLHFGL